ncbi:MAG: histidinol-phosphatase [Opitutaceae bacterium]|jgi:myo-inositol-1(or 4)-monophosphatase|nr:histidinol-phosphatase [Opitutaceae bacterium]
MNLVPYKRFAVELARASGELIRPFFGDLSLAVETKADASPVTRADRAAEEMLRDLIAQKFPWHGVVGEEFGEDRPDAEFVWVLDPIDGTKSFISGCPLFGTLIALKHLGRPVLGVIHQPVLGQLLIGDGSLSELNGRAVRVRECRRLADATLLTSDPLNPARHRNGAAFAAVAEEARVFRTWGDCYGYLLVASGFADIMCDPIVNPWDIQAILPIIRGAGGVVTDWHGGEPDNGDSLLAAHPLLHGRLVELLNP